MSEKFVRKAVSVTLLDLASKPVITWDLAVVTALAELVGVLSGLATTVVLLYVSGAEFAKGARIFYQPLDAWYGLVKAASFGAAVALFGAAQGLATRGGAEGVGRATTRAVVLGAMAILVLDAFWAVVLL